MKLTSKIIAAALLSLPLLASAGQQLCDADTIHCTTFESAQGKYVKATGSFGSETDTFIDCVDNTTSIEIPSSAVQSGFLHVGDVFTAEYRQCKDKYCRDSIQVGSESFTIDKKPQGGYTTTPASFVVKLDNTYGQTCTPAFRSVSMTRQHKQ